MGRVYNLRRTFVVFFAILALSAIAIWQSGAQLALAGDKNGTSSLSATEVSVSLMAPTATNGASANLHRVVYHANDELIVTWKGGIVDNDLIIPTAIKVNGVTRVSMSELNKIDSVQIANTEYSRRMNGEGTMTTFESLRDYLSSEHSVSLGTVTVSSNVEVQYTRVSPVYRMYNMITSEHLFSTNKTEYDGWVQKCELDQDFWIGEGIEWLAPSSTENTKTVHRLYNAALGAMGRSSHYYTSDEEEMARLITPELGWVDDGEDNWFRSGGTTPIYTCYNEDLGSAHHYTSNKTEWQGLEAHGWELEEDKNGTNPARDPEGVFQCTMATNWTFSPNYYTIKHMLENLDGTYSLEESQVVAGEANTDTNAAPRNYPGFTPQDVIVQTNILQNNATKIQINYTRNSYDTNFETSENGISVAKQTGKHGTSVAHPGAVNTSEKNVTGWYYDSGFKYEFNFDTDKLPIGGLILYANWGNSAGDKTDTGQDSNTGITDENGQVTVLDPKTGKETLVTVTYDDDSDTTTPEVPLVGATVKISSYGNVSITSKVDVTDKSVTANLKQDNVGVPDRNVTLIGRGTEVTDKNGDAKFSAGSRGTTGEDGKVEITDPTNNEKLIITVTYDKDDTNSNLEPLSGASVEISKDGKVYVNVPSTAKERTVSVEVTGASTEKTVILSDEGVERATKTTTSGIATFGYYKVSFNLNGGESTVTITDQRIKEGGLAQAPTAEVTKLRYTFGGWYKSFADSAAFDFSSQIYENTTLTAKWVVKDVVKGDYWIAPASRKTTGNTAETANMENPEYVSAETGIIRGQDDIQEDVALIAADPNGAVAQEYRSWMTTDSYHLYTKLAGEGEGAENDYVEFRIVEVGSHIANGESDGTALTFQAIHSLPEAYQMNTTDSNTGGWSGSTLYKNLNTTGSMQSLFNAGFINDISWVNKLNTEGTNSEGGTSADLLTSANKLWLMSFTELWPTSLISSYATGANYEKEGDRYSYWKHFQLYQGTSACPNYALEGLGLMRDGSSHGGAEKGTMYIGGTNYDMWYHRSVYRAGVAAISSGTYGFGVGWQGRFTTTRYSPYTLAGTPLCFSFKAEDKTEKTAQYTVKIYKENDAGDGYNEATATLVGKIGETTDISQLPAIYGYEMETDKVSPVQITEDGKTEISVYYKRLTYTVTFDTQGGSAIPSQTIKYWKKVVRPEHPTKQGSTFAGWYKSEVSGALYNFNYVVDEDMTLVAKWCSDNSETVLYDTTEAALTNPADGKQYIIYVSGKTYSATETSPIERVVVAFVDGKVTVTLPSDASLMDVYVTVKEAASLSPVGNMGAIVQWFNSDMSTSELDSGLTDETDGSFVAHYRTWYSELAGPSKCLSDEIKTGTCRICGDVKKETVPCIGSHNLVDYDVDGVAQECTQCNHVFFGEYAQSDATGATKDVIEWTKLGEETISDNGEKQQLLISLQTLDNKAFNASGNGAGANETIWKTSTVRKWLNGTAYPASDSTAVEPTTEGYYNDCFYDEAFPTQSLKDKVVSTTLTTNLRTDNSASMRTTQDKVFLLSWQEAADTSYFPYQATKEGYSNYTYTRVSWPTVYAKAKGLYQSSDNNGCNWLLRSQTSYPMFPGYQYYVSMINSTSQINTYAVSGTYSTGIRPCINFNLSHSAGRQTIVEGTSGTTDSTGKVEIADPSSNNEKITVSVTYDSNDTNENLTALQGATVEAKGNGRLHVSIPDIAKDKTLKVSVEGGSGAKTVVVYADGYKVDSKTTTSGEATLWYYKVSFDNNGGTGDIPYQKVKEGGAASNPVLEPRREGKRFLGWCESPTKKDTFDFSKTINGDTTLYAQWRDSVETAFAVYSADDQSLYFYKRNEDSLPQVGSTFEGKTVTAIYTDVENMSGEPAWKPKDSYDFTTQKPAVLPAYKSVKVVDAIKPISTASWFSSFSSLEVIDLTKLDTSATTDMTSMFSGCSSLKSLDLSTFDTSAVTSMGGMFSSCYGLSEIDLSSFNTSEVTSMWGMFSYCTSLTELDFTSTKIKNFVTDKVAYMNNMFSGCRSLQTINLSTFNTSQVTSMYQMFNSCEKLQTLDLSSFNTSNVTSMEWMFNGCKALTSLNLAGFDTGKVTSMRYMFNGCSGLTSLDISSLNTSKVQNMSYMFYGMTGLTSLDVSSLDTSSATNMSSMFSYSSNLTSLDLSTFVTDKVTDMSHMFNNCKALTSVNFNGFNTSNVATMYAMFYSCTALETLDISNFNTSKVANMQQMFQECTSLKTVNLGTFDTTNVTNMYAMFYNCKVLTLDCSEWNVLMVTNNYSFNYNAPGVTTPTWRTT